MTTRVFATLWVVTWRHRRPEPMPGASEDVTGRSHVLTSDPTGRDVYATAELVVLGPERVGTLGFTVVEATRCCDVQGTATQTAQGQVN